MITSPVHTYEQMSGILAYDPDTGSLIWKVSAGRVSAGCVAGTISVQGYVSVKVLGKQYRAHRLAWLLHCGTWPVREIDHINGVRDDNRIDNLREATSSENNQNKTKQATNTSGLKGVGWHKASGAWRARIALNGNKQHLGLFPTRELAHAAYCEAAERLHKNFMRLT